uniref:PH domain-containing protein n=1 Tax=Periophthalmus magnuspinnatus TaxID=409849 RepID=A0A3B4A516_9GOBI
PDLLNFKKGWMSKLDNSGEWKKHWFVLTDAGLKYYRDSTAEEQKDDLDGEIDLKSCTKVSELDVEKNYGFQIHTREAVFTLSAMTAGIRRNWIEVLKKCVRPSSSPDLTDKENSHVRFSRQSSEHSSHTPSPQRRFDYVELSPVPNYSAPPSNQREAGEGQGREHSQWQEERNTSSQWEALLSRKTPGGGTNQRLHKEEEIERKWAEFERLPLKDMSSLKASRSSSQSANEALQREVASLRQQLENLQGGGRGGGGQGKSCGLEAPCGRSLSAIERAHRQALEELKRQHDRQMKELQAEKDRLLLEETQATAQIKTLKNNHKEELEREVEKVKRLSGADSQTLQTQLAEIQSLQRELAGLSERYSQKCLELNRAEQENAQREREISNTERDMEILRKENQEKRLACERYTEVHEELSGLKGRNERELQSLREHLRLAMAALQEGQKLGNSLDH